MNVQPARLEPVPRPLLRDARVVGDVVLERHVVVVVQPGFAVEFVRATDETWEGGRVVTAAVGLEVDEGFLRAARSVALEAFRAEVLRRTGAGDLPAETVRCPECERLLTSIELAAAAARVVGVDCAPAHVVRLDGGRSLVIRPDGSSAWVVDDDPQAGSDVRTR